MTAEVLLRAVHHRTPVLAGLAAVDCVPLPHIDAFWDIWSGQLSKLKGLMQNG